MAPHSSTLAWKITWAEEPRRLQSMGSRRVRHDRATSLSLFTFMHWRRKWQPTPVFLPGESRDGGAWWAAVYGVAQSRTRLKRLSSSSIHQGMPWRAEEKHEWKGETVGNLQFIFKTIRVLWITHSGHLKKFIFIPSLKNLPLSYMVRPQWNY